MQSRPLIKESQESFKECLRTQVINSSLDSDLHETYKAEITALKMKFKGEESKSALVLKFSRGEFAGATATVLSTVGDTCVALSKNSKTIYIKGLDEGNAEAEIKKIIDALAAKVVLKEAKVESGASSSHVAKTQSNQNEEYKQILREYLIDKVAHSFDEKPYAPSLFAKQKQLSTQELKDAGMDFRSIGGLIITLATPAVATAIHDVLKTVLSVSVKGTTVTLPDVTESNFAVKLAPLKTEFNARKKEAAGVLTELKRQLAAKRSVLKAVHEKVYLDANSAQPELSYHSKVQGSKVVLLPAKRWFVKDGLWYHPRNTISKIHSLFESSKFNYQTYSNEEKPDPKMSLENMRKEIKKLNVEIIAANNLTLKMAPLIAMAQKKEGYEDILSAFHTVPKQLTFKGRPQT